MVDERTSKGSLLHVSRLTELFGRLSGWARAGSLACLLNSENWGFVGFLL